MKIEIDLEKLVSRIIIDEILNNSSHLRKEVNRILENDDFRKILAEQVKNSINEIISSEDGKQQLDKNIKDEILTSDMIQNEIEEILESGEYQKILEQRTKDCIREVIFSEEGKNQVMDKIKEYLENYEIDYNDEFSDELNKGISDILIMTIRDSLERLKSNIR